MHRRDEIRGDPGSSADSEVPRCMWRRAGGLWHIVRRRGATSRRLAETKRMGNNENRRVIEQCETQLFAWA